MEAGGHQPRTQLHLCVGRHPEGAWWLIVRPNHKGVVFKKIDEKTAPDGWTTVVADLSRFAGKTIWLELLDKDIGSPHPEAYWAEIRLESR